MSKKPAEQTGAAAGSADADNEDLDLEADADDLDNDGDDTDDDDEDGEDGGAGSGTPDVAKLVQKGIREAMAEMNRGFQSEMDRRINSALKTKTPAAKTGAKAEEEQTVTTSDLRGARIAFREYLPEEIKLLSVEEKRLATEFGQNLLRAAAADGFEDEDAAGRDAAQKTAKFLQDSRKLYSSRTKRALAKQGGLKDQKDGQAGGGTGGTTDDKNAFDAAKARRERLFPVRP